MEYKPGQEPVGPNNVNVSHASPVREFAVLLGGAAALLACVYFVLGLLIDFAVDRIDPKTEKKLFAHLGAAFDTDSSSDAEEELQSIVDAMQQCLDPGYDVTVSLTEETSPNAFALPGGRMIVTRGLLDFIESENGLAFVIAHELGHFANRDHLRGLGRGVVLATLSSVVVGADSGLSAVFTPASMAGQARFSRSRESDADAVALAAVQCHYGHVTGSHEFFNQLEDLDEGAPILAAYQHYFSSHPDVSERIAALDALAAAQSYGSGRVRTLPRALQ